MHAARTALSRASILLALALACGDGGAVSTAATGTDSDGTTQAATGSTGSTGSTAPDDTSTSAPTTGAPSSSSTAGETTGNGATTDSTDSGDTSTGGTSTGDTSTTGPDSTGSTGSTSTGLDTTTTGTSGSTGDDTTGGGGELGVLSGDCGLIDAMEVTSPEPFVFSGAIDFGVVGFDYALLTPGGKEIHDEGNLNASSLHSEIVAYEVLARCDMAALLKTEAEIVYQNPMGKKTDILVELDGHKVGVSVVRAVGFPFENPYTVQQAESMLTGKLGDILISSANVAPEDAWVKQILSVVAYGPMHLDSILTAYAGLSPMLKADTILVVTVTDGDDAFIY